MQKQLKIQLKLIVGKMYRYGGRVWLHRLDTYTCNGRKILPSNVLFFELVQQAITIKLINMNYQQQCKGFRLGEQLILFCFIV